MVYSLPLVILQIEVHCSIFKVVPHIVGENINITDFDERRFETYRWQSKMRRWHPKKREKIHGALSKNLICEKKWKRLINISFLFRFSFTNTCNKNISKIQGRSPCKLLSQSSFCSEKTHWFYDVSFVFVINHHFIFEHLLIAFSFVIKFLFLN